ncbi:MAG: thiol:disulfide interchange protein DsbA/DsbL [Xanthomonadaceae bacterium]|jgi:thiol:disulfide interchange protein DsbA|nr:thiol:disulfide interchange protein DsbA/DsbL [Xanthomonadaceae bacterium]
MKLRMILALAPALLVLAACTSQQAPTAQQQSSATATGSASGNNAGPAPVAGTDYVEIADGRPLLPGTGKIEVTEIFGYTCVHCAHFEPELDEWQRTLPEDVNFIRVPGVFGGIWDPFARAYYTAEELNILDQSHDDMFDAVQNRRITGVTPNDFANFYSQYGVDAGTFARTFADARIDAKLKRAQQFEVQSKIEGTPSMVVNGKHTVTVNASGFKGMLATVEWLIEQERKATAL